MSYILRYHCKTAAGERPNQLMQSLLSGVVHATRDAEDNIPAFTWQDRNTQSYREQMRQALLECWIAISTPQYTDEAPANIGVILATTKGFTEDYVWRTDDVSPKQRDLLSPLLDDFIATAKLSPIQRLCLSNACSSSHAALYVAKHWLDTKTCDHVLVMSCDLIGPFITKGFSALKALASGAQRPFSAQRDGLLLGDGVAMILLSSEAKDDAAIALSGVQTISEGIAATRSGEDGASLKRCIEDLAAETPDLIIAHGTATPTNDRIEDRVYTNMYASRVPITGTKWCVGHTMSASGAIDIIAACESMRTQQSFGLMASDPFDASLRGAYQRNAETAKLDKVLVCSLGFGGVQAAALLEKTKLSVAPVQKKYRYKQISETLRNLDLGSASEQILAKVERWNQLDDAAKALVLLNQQWGHSSRDLIILASPEGSYETDRAFAQNGAMSPSRFVHTLPSTRGSALLQAMDWSGPVLCVQSGVSTVQKAIELGSSFVEHKGWTVQIFSYFSKDFTGEESGSASVMTLQPMH